MDKEDPTARQVIKDKIISVIQEYMKVMEITDAELLADNNKETLINRIKAMIEKDCLLCVVKKHKVPLEKELNRIQEVLGSLKELTFSNLMGED